jgi:hypothetical protein
MNVESLGFEVEIWSDWCKLQILLALKQRRNGLVLHRVPNGVENT